MPSKRVRKPAYALHKATGQARVRIDGKDHYLGAFGSPESRDRYDDLIAEWLTRNGDVIQYRLRVADLAMLYLDHAESYYRKDGEPTSELSCVRIALRHLIDSHGKTRARDFDAEGMESVQKAMIDAGVCRKSINTHCGRIRRMFKWAARKKHVPKSVYIDVAMADGLKRGRTEARESEPVKPVPAASIDAVRPHVSRQVWGMIQLQLFTGMRPGEVLIMRGCDLVTSGKVWEYTPERHKTEHHGKNRIVFLGPKAQAVVREFLKADTTAYLFSPADARAERDARRRTNRKTPMTPSQAARRPKAAPKRKPGDKYTVYSYRQAVAKACEKAGVDPLDRDTISENAGRTDRGECFQRKLATGQEAACRKCSSPFC